LATPIRSPHPIVTTASIATAAIIISASRRLVTARTYDTAVGVTGRPSALERVASVNTAGCR
jgi:hypothetical protein